MKETLPNLIDLYLKKRQQGASFSYIRKELMDSGFNREDISFIIRKVDELEVKNIKNISDNVLGNEKILCGLLLMVVAAICLIIFIKSIFSVLGLVAILFCVSTFVMGKQMFTEGKHQKNK